MLDVVAILRVDELPDWTEAGSNDAVAPLGRPVAVSWTVCAEPLPITVLIVAVAVSPGLTEPLAGETDIVKSLPVGVQVASPDWAPRPRRRPRRP